VDGRGVLRRPAGAVERVDGGAGIAGSDRPGVRGVAAATLLTVGSGTVNCLLQVEPSKNQTMPPPSPPPAQTCFASAADTSIGSASSFCACVVQETPLKK